MKLFFQLATYAMLPLSLAVTGCDGQTHSNLDQAQHHGNHAHHHAPPHGGTPIQLGDELYHMEWVKDEDIGIMRCYIFDGHMETFVRISQETFEVNIPLEGKESKYTWTFSAIANRSTGETIGNSSEFHAPLESLPNQNKFEGILQEIHIEGQYFRNIPVRYPEGNEGN
jgi:hypothetical protein